MQDRMPNAAKNLLYELDGLRFALGDRELLAPLTLQLPRGRVYGLIGHNGSGKSTLLKLLARQQAPSGGVIRFEGRPLDAWASRDFARRVAYLPQQPPATLGMTVAELVAFGRYPWHGALGRFGALDHDKVAEAMQLTEVTAFADRFVDSLSGGERQRVWLAMLVAQDAECLLLDEPTSALDVSHQLEVLALARDLSQKRGLGVVVVLHDVNMAARFCDALIALKHGKLVAQGVPADLMNPATLAQIYGVPMGIVPHPGGGVPISFAW